jgi:glycosyltransferase involved in cell wall biosynthesis
MVNPNSDEMDELCANNAFVLFPSCSEGTASSVITCMAKGLIPIVTKESGVNLNDFGIEIESGTVDAVKDAIEIALKLPIKEIKRQRNLVQQFVVNNHSVDAYKYHLKYALEKVI